MPIARWVRKQGGQILGIQAPPHEIAMGLAIGVFLGFTPLFGLKTLLAMGVARVFRSSIVAAAVGVALHDLILPLTPLLLHWEFGLGRLVLGHGTSGFDAGSRLSLRHLRPEEWLHWSTFLTVGSPLLLGSALIGLVPGIAAYWGALVIIKRRRARLAAREAEQQQHI